MEQFLRQLQTIPEAAELIRRVEEGGCPAAVSGLQPVQRACVGAAVALAVSLSLLVTVMVSKCLGGLLPIAAKAVHLDPAVMASPLITTVVDAVSLLVYFGFARAILGI